MVDSYLQQACWNHSLNMNVDAIWVIYVALMHDSENQPGSLHMLIFFPRAATFRSGWRWDVKQIHSMIITKGQGSAMSGIQKRVLLLG